MYSVRQYKARRRRHRGRRGRLEESIHELVISCVGQRSHRGPRGSRFARDDGAGREPHWHGVTRWLLELRRYFWHREVAAAKKVGEGGMS